MIIFILWSLEVDCTCLLSHSQACKGYMTDPMKELEWKAKNTHIKIDRVLQRFCYLNNNLNIFLTYLIINYLINYLVCDHRLPQYSLILKTVFIVLCLYLLQKTDNDIIGIGVGSGSHGNFIMSAYNNTTIHIWDTRGKMLYICWCDLSGIGPCRWHEYVIFLQSSDRVTNTHQ